MAEQSSTVVAFRGLVMLICLILIPVAAFCGSSFPAVVKAIQSGRWPTLADFHAPAGPPSAQGTEAPRFLPPASATSQMGNYRPAQQGELTHSQVVAANYAAPIGPAPSFGGPSTNYPQYQDLGRGAGGRLSPLPAGAGDLLPVDREATRGHSEALASGAGSANGGQPSDPFNYVQNRLRQLGATYFLLETCSDEKSGFRFFCKMAVAGNPGVTKPFWRMDSDPLKAMTEVLKQVEEWHGKVGLGSAE